MKRLTYAAATMLAVFGSAQASAKTILQPVQVGDETLRFRQGVPTLDLRGPHGGVQITPLEMDHGSYAFTVAVLNTGSSPADFDIANMDINAGPQHLAVFSKDQLVRKAKTRALWTQIAIAAVGGVAAGLAASQQDHYHATTRTRYGTYRSVVSTPSALGQVEAVAAIAGSSVAIASVQNRLDQTRAVLGDSTVQMTTVDPGNGYAGRIVIEKLKAPTTTQRIDMVVNWNGDRYPFAFQIVKEGTPQPAFINKPEPMAPVIPAVVTAPAAPPAPAAPLPAVVPAVPATAVAAVPVRVPATPARPVTRVPVAPSATVDTPVPQIASAAS